MVQNHFSKLCRSCWLTVLVKETTLHKKRATFSFKLPLVSSSKDFAILSLDGSRQVEEQPQESARATVPSILDHYIHRPSNPTSRLSTQVLMVPWELFKLSAIVKVGHLQIYLWLLLYCLITTQVLPSLTAQYQSYLFAVRGHHLAVSARTKKLPIHFRSTGPSHSLSSIKMDGPRHSLSPFTSGVHGPNHSLSSIRVDGPRHSLSPFTS